MSFENVVPLVAVHQASTHSALSAQRHLSYLMEFDRLTPSTLLRNDRPTIFRLRRKGLIILRTVGIEIAKQRPDGSWLVRNWYHRNVRISYRILDVEYVLRQQGYSLCSVDPRTTWNVWRPPA